MERSETVLEAWRPWGDRLFFPLLFAKRRELALFPPVERGRAWADWLLSLPSVDRNDAWTAEYGLQPRSDVSYTRSAFLDTIPIIAARPAVARSFVRRMRERVSGELVTGPLAADIVRTTLLNLHKNPGILRVERTHPHAVAPLLDWALPIMGDPAARVEAVAQSLRSLKEHQVFLVEPALRAMADKETRDEMRRWLYSRWRSDQSTPAPPRRPAATSPGPAVGVYWKASNSEPGDAPGTVPRLIAVARSLGLGGDAYTELAAAIRRTLPEAGQVVLVGQDVGQALTLSRFLKHPNVVFAPLSGSDREVFSRELRIHGVSAERILDREDFDLSFLIDETVAASPSFFRSGGFDELPGIDAVAEYADHDPFVVWGAQDMRRGVRVWSDGRATAVLSPVLWKNRLFVCGDPTAARDLVHYVANELALPVQRVWGEAQLIDQIRSDLPWLAAHEAAWEMHTRDVDAPDSSPLPGRQPRWRRRADEPIRKLLSKGLPWSYSRHPAPVELWARVEEDGKPVSIASLAWGVRGVSFLSGVVTDPERERGSDRRPKYRNRGIGGSVIRETVEAGIKRDGEVMLLVGTGHDSEAAVRRYEALGMSKRLVKSARPLPDTWAAERRGLGARQSAR